MTRVRALVVTGLFWMCGSAAPGEEGLFPFVVSYDTPASATNVSTRLDWATVTMTVIEGQGFAGPGRLLIAATGLVQNKGAQLQTLGGKRVTLGDRWGDAPVWCEGIAAEVVLPLPADRVTVYPLDTAGNRRSSVKPTARDGRAVIAIGPACKTLWYEVELR